jgi:DMSO/TMAO reductase YedYZ heme-binding membrane subunit
VSTLVPLLASGSVTWYVARATGVVSLVFLTASVLLGILTSFRWSSPNWPRFVVEFVHRNVSLLVVAFVAVHVVVVVADSFAPIGVLDAVVPFISSYRPLWLGFGAIAFDLLVALVVTSLLRHRFGYRAWRIVHWLAYLCWPVAVLHGLGTGSDTRSGVVLALTAVCIVAVLVAAALRLGVALVRRPGARIVGLGALAALPVLLVLWLVSGPLADGWARRAGTPSQVLASAASAGGSGGSASSGATVTTLPATTAPATTQPARVFGAGGFSASTSGTYHQSGPDSAGQYTVSLVGTLGSGAAGTLDVEIIGVPASGGGVSMTSGTVTVSDGRNSYRGDIVELNGGDIVAQMPGPGGANWQVQVALTQLDRASGRMAGQVQASPATSGGDRRGGGDDH